MKKELLEHLVRSCVREVLSQIREDDQTLGASAPPADGQGSAEQPAIPKDKDSRPELPSEPETPPSTNLKGVVFVNPKDKSKLQKISLKSGDDATIERTLHRIGAATAGNGIKVASATLRGVKDVLKNPNTTLYLYVGKYDPASEEMFLMADKSLNVAKESSVPVAELGGGVGELPSNTDELPPSAGEIDQRLRGGGQTPVYGGVDETLRKVVKKMVNEILDRR